MATLTRCCCWFKRQQSAVLSDESKPERRPKSVNILLGCFFLINYNLGNGFLTYPYSFYYAGYLAAIPTLLLITFMCTIAAIWEVEVMARAQALETFTDFCKSFGSGNLKDEDKKLESANRSEYDYQHPDFKVLLTRKFELSELCEIFISKWAKYLYMILAVLVSLLFAWGMAAIVGSALATNIPLNFGPFNQCHHDAFNNRVIPSEECLPAYYFCLVSFAVIIVPPSMLDLKELVIFQVFFGLLRVLLISMLVIYCIVNLFQGNSSQEMLNGSNMTNAGNLESDVVFKFDWKGWLTAIPVMTYSYMVHQTIPALTHPIKEKKYLGWFMMCSFGFAGLCYLLLGVVVPLWFRDETQETVTLSWGKFASPENPIYLRAISYCILFIPLLIIASVYPLNVHPMVNNIYTVVMGHDTSKSPRNIRYRFLLLMLRFLVALIPILLAFGISNLVTVVQYTGLFAFLAIFFFPTVLQLQSIRVCKRRFRDVHVHIQMVRNVSSNVSDSKCGKDGDKGTVNSSTEVVLHSLQFTQSRDESSLYMTPYSSRVFSHPIGVAMIGAIALLLFFLSITSVIVQHFNDESAHGSH